MKVIYAILATAGWVWLAVVFVYVWVRTRPAKGAVRGFEVLRSEPRDEQRQERQHEHEEQR